MNIRLRNKITGLFYNDGQCFTCKEGKIIEKDSPEHVVIRHTYLPDHIEEVPVGNKHLEPGLKPKVLPNKRWDSCHYVFGDWSIEIYKYNQNKGCHRYIRLSRPDYVTNWDAHNSVTNEKFSYQCGGIKKAVAHIIKHERNRNQ
jgi:hypothetical protein